MRIGLNGQIISHQEAVISVYDHGFLYGMGIFETFRTYDGQIPFLDRHLGRLRESLLDWGIRFEVSNERIREHLLQLLEANDLGNAYFRLSVSAGCAEVGLPAGDYLDPTWVVYIKPLPAFPQEWYTHGRDLYLLRTPRNEPETIIRRKSFQFANNIFGKRELGVRSGEGILLTRQGDLAEGLVSNLFFIQNSQLLTPCIETGILPGITREIVMELASENGLTVKEGFYPAATLFEVEEAFVTNSVMEIVPVSRVEGCVVGAEAPGPVTTQIMHWYDELRKREGAS